MASPFSAREHDAVQQPPSQTMDGDGRGPSNVSRQLMRVKVLYTFDDQNKSNCLARLPNAMHIPTVFLDETTQVGVIELKTCIQAIVAASPELVAKLGHDYTVYAYDFSEYETPLVGQGLLSWILASASATPNAPAEQSQTMVTGRVCKNILGLFSNGVNETLEVKLKLIPVPTCMQQEYVENMERYHSLSRVMPDGLDYKAWAEFLKANPAISQLAQSRSGDHSQGIVDSCQPFGSIGQHQMLTPHPMPPQEQTWTDLHMMPNNAYETRASSPAMSTASYRPYPNFQDSRPNSQASVRNEVAPQSHGFPSPAGIAQEHQEEEPPKKRARVTKASRPRKTTLAVNNESLRVTASTAASVRLHRPAATGPAADIASMEQVPRAPTPRPGDKGIAQHRGIPRVPPSLLRHASLDDGRSPLSSFEAAVYSDGAMDSADDERGNSPDEPPMDIPSSPPVMPKREVSSAPSSPGLPTLPYPADSGFVSDLPPERDENEDARPRVWDGSDLPTLGDGATGQAVDKLHYPWTQETPGPVELLPRSYVPKPKTYPRVRQSIEKMEKATKSVPEPLHGDRPGNTQTFLGSQANGICSNQPNHSGGAGPTDAQDANPISAPGDKGPYRSAAVSSTEQLHQQRVQQTIQRHKSHDRGVDSASPDATTPRFAAFNNDTAQPLSRAATPNPPPKRSGNSKPRGLPRSQTWSGDPMSDGAFPSESNSHPPRSGSGAKRKQVILNKLQESLAAGELPPHCSHCGEIETPTWRKAFTRVEVGSPTEIQLSSEGTNITAYEIIASSDNDDDPQKYRIFKQALTREEKEGNSFQHLNLCNPCGLWLRKNRAMRPPEVWGKRAVPTWDKPKRKRYPPKRKENEFSDIQSDAALPYSEPATPFESGDAGPNPGGPADVPMPQHMRSRASSFQVGVSADAALMDDTTALAALRRAIQSSPVGLRGSQDLPIELEPDLTPKPTRRLLFPSPRKTGEIRSLEDSSTYPSSTANIQPLNDTETTAQLPDLPDLGGEETDKENCPPLTAHDDDDLAHLFEEHISPKTTPTKGSILEELLKTPTPGSRKRNALTPKRTGGSNTSVQGLTTPSRNTLTPSRSGRAATLAAETPFTRQMNAFLTECMGSPSQALDFTAFPALNLTPGRSSAIQFSDFDADNFLSSDLPIPSSPPGLGFSVFEDPSTSTIGLWSGASIFEGSDAVTMEVHHQHEEERKPQGKVPKTTEISVDFAAMIDGVVGNGTEDTQQSKGKEVAENDQPAAQTV